MTEAEFDRRARAARMGGRACDAARLVLVDGLSRYAAAEKIGVNISAVSRASAKIARMRVCRSCGQTMD